jgi:hypothetical protein
MSMHIVNKIGIVVIAVMIFFFVPFVPMTVSYHDVQCDSYVGEPQLLTIFGSPSFAIFGYSVGMVYFQVEGVQTLQFMQPFSFCL